MALFPRAEPTVRMSGCGGGSSVARPLAQRGKMTDAVEEVGGESDEAWLIDD